MSLFNSASFSAEADKQELINAAQGAAQAVVAAGQARAQSIEIVAKALEGENGHDAAGLAVAEKYVQAFEKLAKTNNTLILPSNTGDVSSMVAQVSGALFRGKKKYESIFSSEINLGEKILQLNQE